MANQKIIRQQLINYLKRAKRLVPIDRAYLVGSWAKGNAKPESDIDILILSKAFSKLDPDERLRLLYRSTVGLDLALHIHAITPQEAESASGLTTLGAMYSDKKITLSV